MSEARQRAVARACESNDVRVEAELLVASLEEVGLHWERSWAAGRHLPPREAAETLVRALGVEGAAGEMVAEAFLGAGLRARGSRLGIVCDVGFSGGELLRELLAGEGLLDHFSGWAFSDEVGHYKPSPRIFEAALGSLGARPEASLHVGDLRRTDVAGAAAFGMRTARYRGIHDDADLRIGAEADVVIDSHLELIDAIERP